MIVIVTAVRVEVAVVQKKERDNDDTKYSLNN